MKINNKKIIKKKPKLFYEKPSMFRYSSDSFIVPYFYDKSLVSSNIQKRLINWAEFLILNRFLGFEHIILAQKQK